ncbi:MAG TPA: PadR family transcriptional regulator [Candidatus Hydrogenedentes bacterium]|nr:PadR family transcriptional regulator [Candidatus Hydrogenedentota bacterium]HQM47355.1 PadR family transcriptional regulator [Candidatus Hydrogenedentota bacterium]
MKQSHCPCSGATLDHFLRPAVMAVLARAPAGLHAYVISQHLRDAAIISDSPPDAMGLDRVLKAMEKEGYFRSDWDTEGSSPAKRVYALTEEGWNCLQRWKNTLDAHSRNLEQTVTFIERSPQPVSKEIRQEIIHPCCVPIRRNAK